MSLRGTKAKDSLMATVGDEFRAKGVNVALGPVVGPLGRIASSGRNWEGKASCLVSSLESSKILMAPRLLQ